MRRAPAHALACVARRLPTPCAACACTIQGTRGTDWPGSWHAAAGYKERATGGSLLLTPSARAKPVPTHLRAGHRASASTDHDDKISLEAAERLRAGARGSRELLRCRCSLLGSPAPCLRRGSSEDVTARRRWSAAPPQPQPAAPAPALATSEAVASVRLNRETSAMKIE